MCIAIAVDFSIQVQMIQWKIVWLPVWIKCDILSGVVLYLVRVGEDNSAGTVKGARRRGRQKKRWEDNIKEWTGMGFADSLRAVEDWEGWKGNVAMSSVVPRRPPRLRD